MAEKKNLILRISPELWQELQAWAGTELRSINGQIEFLLGQAVRARRKSFGAEKEPPPSKPSPE